MTLRRQIISLTGIEFDFNGSFTRKNYNEVLMRMNLLCGATVCLDLKSIRSWFSGIRHSLLLPVLTIRKNSNMDKYHNAATQRM